MSSLVPPWVDARLMSLFLAHTARRLAAEHGVVFLDGPGWREAHELKTPANMSLLSSPPYRPELNPAEHVGEYVRETDMRNRICADLDEVMETVSQSLHRLHQQPQTLRSMIAFPWILEAAA